MDAHELADTVSLDDAQHVGFEDEIGADDLARSIFLAVHRYLEAERPGTPGAVRLRVAVRVTDLAMFLQAGGELGEAPAHLGVRERQVRDDHADLRGALRVAYAAGGLPWPAPPIPQVGA